MECGDKNLTGMDLREIRKRSISAKGLLMTTVTYCPVLLRLVLTCAL